MTDMVNLGPSLKAMPDLRSTRTKEPAEILRSGKEEAPGSFEKVLSEKTNLEAPGTLAKYASGVQKKIGNKSGTNESVNEMENKGESNPVSQQLGDSDEGAETQRDILAEKIVGKPTAGLGKLTDRQQVMKKFMDSMESEFNIAPEEIVGAMAQLSDKELLLSPEKTAPQIIEKLDLKGYDANRAEAMFLAMTIQLAALRDSPTKNVLPADEQLNSYLRQNPELAGGGAGMALLAAKDRRQMLNDSLDKMNSRFFLKPEMKLPTEVVDSAASSTHELKTDFVERSGKFEIPKGFQTVDPKPLKLDAGIEPRSLKSQGEVRTEDLRKALLELGAAAGALNSVMQKEEEAAETSPMLMATAPTPKSAESVKVLETSPNLTANTEQVFAALVAGSKAQDLYGKSGNGSSSFGSTGKGPSADEKSGLTKAQGASADFVMPNLMPTKELGSPQVAVGGLVAATAAGVSRQEADADAQNNLQALVKQAQYMIKKGGGEASVKMNPEGMGQVHLRVMLSEGKVNVEFKTETAEAKKMLESNIGDLKDSLSVHRLAVDHVKVDVGNQLSSSSDHQRGQEQTQQQFKQDPQREQARQFFNQFHEDNLSRREGYYDTKGAKAYSRTKPVEALRPGDEAPSAKARRDLGRGVGSGLDLVA